MQVELLNITPDALNFIGKCASICYDSDSEDRARNERRAVGCATKGHLATLRFAHATFKVSGISRACSHQFVRSKHLDFLQKSQRYVSETGMDIVIPDTIQEDEACAAYYKEFMIDCVTFYKYLLDHGIKKEDARFVLPNATETELIVTGNLQAWLDFINLRATKEAQWEIRDVAIAINNALATEVNGIFETINADTTI